MNNKKKVLYLSYTGMLEPLGRSQVLAYLSRLSNEYEFTIISFEKKQDYLNTSEVAKLMAECEQFGIKWQPKVYHKRPKVVSTLWDMLILFYSAFINSYNGKADLVHCRSYITGAVGLLSGIFTRVPFLFDMRALLPEELVDAKRVKAGSLLHKSICMFERLLLKHSAAVVSLTHAAVPYLIKQYPFLCKEKFTVIPTCVDLTRFDNVTPQLEHSSAIGTMGTLVSGWYHLDWLAKTLQLSQDVFGIQPIKIITRDDPKFILNELNSHGGSAIEVDIFSASLDDVQARIRELRFGILFFTSGTSKLGSAPTRMAEFLACGIPILGNRGVGDMASIIEKYNIGVVIESNDDSEIKRGLLAMKVLLEDEQLAIKKKKAAQDIFSADIGANKYGMIYKSIVES